MARKGKEIQLQREIETQEDWEDMLSKEGLCVVDVYQEWCGPTVGMVGTFKKIKNELGDDLLKFIIAKSDTIDALEKYRGRCEPCFLFFAGGVLVAVIRGANAPLILRTITEQLAQEHKVLDGQAERKEIKDTMIAKLEEEEKQREEEAVEEALRMRFQEQIIEFGDDLESEPEPKKEVSVVIIKPDAVQSGKAEEIMEEMRNRGIEILRQEERQLTDEEVKNVYIHLQDEPYFEELVNFMTSAPSIVLAITKGKTGQNIIQEFRELIGPTEVEEAKEQAPESLRAKFGSEKYMNAVHGSDSQDTAARELAFFFPDFVAPTVEGKPKLQRTLALIRPDAYKNNKDQILQKIRESGFKVAMQKEVHLTKEQAEEFYKEHEGQEYFDELTTRMSSGPLLALGLAREDAIAGWRQMLGPTKVEEAKEQEPDSLRAQFAEEGVAINMLHGSDSEETAQKEIEYFFPMEQTLAVIKPDAYGTKDDIVEKIHEAGFRIAARKETTLSREIAEEFYGDLKDKEYYNELVEHMCSGPTYFMVLSREGAVDGWRSLIGPTDPSQAKEQDPETIRGMFGQDTLRNAVHGSSNKEHAMKNIEKIFGELYFNKDGTVKEDTEGVPDVVLHGVPSVDPYHLEEAIAEQQEISYEPAPEHGGPGEQKSKDEPKQETKEEKPPSPKPEEKKEEEEDDNQQLVEENDEQTTEEQAPQQEEQQPAEQEPVQQEQSEAQEEKQEEEAQPVPKSAPEQEPEPEKTEAEEKPKSPEPQAQEAEGTEQAQETSGEAEEKPADEGEPEKPAEQQQQAEPEAEQKEEPPKEEPAEAQQETQPEAQAETQAEAQPEAQPEAQAETTEEKKEEETSEQKEESKTEEQKTEGEEQQAA